MEIYSPTLLSLSFYWCPFACSAARSVVSMSVATSRVYGLNRFPACLSTPLYLQSVRGVIRTLETLFTRLERLWYPCVSKLYYKCFIFTALDQSICQWKPLFRSSPVLLGLGRRRNEMLCHHPTFASRSTLIPRLRERNGINHPRYPRGERRHHVSTTKAPPRNSNLPYLRPSLVNQTLSKFQAPSSVARALWPKNIHS